MKNGKNQVSEETLHASHHQNINGLSPQILSPPIINCYRLFLFMIQFFASHFKVKNRALLPTSDQIQSSANGILQFHAFAKGNIRTVEVLFLKTKYLSPLTNKSIHCFTPIHIATQTILQQSSSQLYCNKTRKMQMYIAAFDVSFCL